MQMRNVALALALVCGTAVAVLGASELALESDDAKILMGSTLSETMWQRTAANTVQTPGKLSVQNMAYLNGGVDVLGTMNVANYAYLNGGVQVTGATNAKGMLTVGTSTAAPAELLVYGATSLAGGVWTNWYLLRTYTGTTPLPVPAATSVPVPFNSDMIAARPGITAVSDTTFRVSRTGIYHVCAAVQWSGSNPVDAQIYLFSSTDPTRAQWVQSASPLSPHVATCGDLYVAANNDIQVYAWAGPGASWGITPARRHLRISLVTFA